MMEQQERVLQRVMVIIRTGVFCLETFFLIASVSNVPKGLMGKERNKIKDWFVYRN